MEVPNTDENASRCICGQCPSYPEGDKGFYCSLDLSGMAVIKKGCICNDCANWEAFELSKGYFCTNGKAS